MSQRTAATVTTMTALTRTAPMSRQTSGAHATTDTLTRTTPHTSVLCIIEYDIGARAWLQHHSAPTNAVYHTVDSEVGAVLGKVGLSKCGADLTATTRPPAETYNRKSYTLQICNV